MEEIIALASLDNKYYILTEDNYEVKAHIIDKSKIKDEFYIAFNDKAPAKIKILRSVDADTVKFIKKVYLNSLFDTYEQAVKRRAKNKLLGMKLKDDVKFLKLIVDKLKLRGYRYKDNLGREVIFLYKVCFRDLKTMQEINMRTLIKIRSANNIDELRNMWVIYTITFKDICGKEMHELFTEITNYYNSIDVDKIIIVIRNSSMYTSVAGVKDGKIINENYVWLSGHSVIEENEDSKIIGSNVDKLKKVYSADIYSRFSLKGSKITWLKD